MGNINWIGGGVDRPREPMDLVRIFVPGVRLDFAENDGNVS